MFSFRVPGRGERSESVSVCKRSHILRNSCLGINNKTVAISPNTSTSIGKKRTVRRPTKRSTTKFELSIRCNNAGQPKTQRKYYDIEEDLLRAGLFKGSGSCIRDLETVRRQKIS